jgi:uncharacterized protein YrrD
MQRSQLIGKPVISARTGNSLGQIEDVLLDHAHRHALGVLVSEGTLSRQQVILFRNLQAVGAGAAIAVDESDIMDARRWLEQGHPAFRCGLLLKKQVVTADGAHLGMVWDVLLEDGTGRVVALALADHRHYAGSPDVRVHVIPEMSLTHDVVVAAHVCSSEPDASARASERS